MGFEICNAGKLATDKLIQRRSTIVLRICNEDIIIEAKNQDARASGLFEGNKGCVSMKQFRAGRNE